MAFQSDTATKISQQNHHRSLSVSLSFLSHGSEISVEQTVFCSYSNGKQMYQTNKEIASFIPFLFFFLSFTEIETATTSQNFQIQLLQLSQTRKQARHQKTPKKIPQNQELKTERWIVPKEKTLQIHGGGKKEEEVQSL